MPTSTEEVPRRGWFRPGMAEFPIIFVGVTAAFVVEGYRQQLDQQGQLRQATDGILTELARYQLRSVEHADSIAARLDRWKTAEADAERAVPGHYRIPGAPRPPTAAWDAAVSSGVASLFEPELRMALGYYYTEFVGIHDNYIRRLAFIEREALPRVEEGAAAVYDSRGRIRSAFRAEMSLLGEFGDDLRASARRAAFLEAWLRTGRRPPGAL